MFLLVFACFIIISLLPSSHLDQDVVWLNIISLSAFAMLMTRLNKPFRETLWVWVILCVFCVGYFFKTLLIASYLDDADIINLINPEWGWLSAFSLSRGYYWITLAFVVFCVTSWLLLGTTKSVYLREKVIESKRGSYHRTMSFLLVITILSIFLMLLRVKLGIGIMGVQTDRLPFRMDTIIFRLQSYVLPVLFLLVVWVTERERWWRGWLMALACLLLYICLLSIVVASRAGLVNFALYTLCLWMVCGFLSWKRMSIVALMGSGTLAFFPFVTAIRGARMGGDLSLISSLQIATGQFGGVDWVEMMRFVANHIILRVGGADGVWFVQGYAPDILSADWGGQGSILDGVVGFYTRNIVGVTHAADFRSPGIIGALMLLGGFFGVVVLWPILLWLIHFIWTRFTRWNTSPVILATFACFLFGFMSEGTLQVQDFISMLIAAFLCEWCYQRLLINKRLPREHT